MNNGLTFGDYFIDKRLEKMENHFIFKVDRLVNWGKIEKNIKKIALKRESVAGCIPYERLTMFKVYLILSWYFFE